VNPLARKGLEVALVEQLRRLPAGAKPNMREIRLALVCEIGSCTPAELAGAVQSLRYQGKLEWGSLSLSPSMIEQSAGPAGPVEAEGGAVAPPPPSASIAAGPDDEDDRDYPGGVNDHAEETVEGPARERALPPEGEARNVSEPLRHDQPALPGGGVEEPRAGGAGDQPAGADGFDRPAETGPAPVPAALSAPYRHYQQPAPGERAKTPGGWTKASHVAGAKPLPPPAHEPEIARQIREECNESAERRRRAHSTGTVRQPLELRKFGVAELSLGEGFASLLAETPHDLMVAVSRRHPLLWRRVLLLGRSSAERPAQALYAAIERGLDELEAELPHSEMEERNVA
jgi:hypothetical protein